jgi:hypothetical protein
LFSDVKSRDHATKGLLHNFQASTSCPSDNTRININTNMEQRWKVSAAEETTASSHIKNNLNMQFITVREHCVGHKDKRFNTVRGNKSYLFVSGTKSIHIMCGKMHTRVVLKQVVHRVTTVP